MKKLVFLVVVAVLSFPAALLAQAGGTMAAPQSQAGKMEKGEPHPEIRQAMQHLRQAKEILQKKADRDFEGHRKQAVESIEQAEEHLRQALAADKKQ